MGTAGVCRGFGGQKASAGWGEALAPLVVLFLGRENEGGWKGCNREITREVVAAFRKIQARWRKGVVGWKYPIPKLGDQ